MSVQNKEARILLAIEAIRSSKKISIRCVSQISDVPAQSLRNKMNGRAARGDTRANSHNLDVVEEEVLLQYILDLDDYPPNLASIKDMADYLRKARDAPPIGQRWARNFVNRHPEVRTRYSRGYDF